MPLLKLETNVGITEEKRNALLASLSKVVAETLGKPEQYVMVSVSNAAMVMSGKAGPAVFGDLRSIGGLGKEANKKIAQKLTKALQEGLGVSPERVYLNFADVAAEDWGWDGGTFA